MENLNGLEIFFGFVNTGAIVTFLYLFVTGKVQSYKVVDKMLEEAQARTDKLSKEVLEGMEKAVRTGMLEAMKEYNGGKKK
jgi:hypothetical protein